MSQKIYQVDAFTSTPYTGNPAAVCILQNEADEKWMQRVALEMNLSETAFLIEQGDGFNLRWFTPAVEVELCGHATLASAHVLWEENYLKPEETARFHTLSGLLTAKRIDQWIELDGNKIPWWGVFGHADIESDQPVLIIGPADYIIFDQTIFVRYDDLSDSKTAILIMLCIPESIPQSVFIANICASRQI